MAILNYTQSKGCFETADSDTSGGFSISDVAVVGEAALAGATPINFIRILDQGHADGDDYAGLDDVTFSVSDGEGTVVKFHIDNDGDGASTPANHTAIATNAVLGNVAPTGIAALITAAINDHASLGKVFAIEQAQVGATETTADYVDVYVFGRTTSNAIGVGTGSPNRSVLPTGVVQAITPASSRKSIDGGVYLSPSAAEDVAAVNSDLGGIHVGALSNGTSAGQMIYLRNNASNSDLVLTGAFNASGSNTICTLGAGRGQVLAWNGSGWILWKDNGAAAVFSG